MSHGDFRTGTSGLICGSIQFSPETNKIVPPNSVAKAKVSRLRRTNSNPEKTVAQDTYTIVSYELLHGAYPAIYQRIPIPYIWKKKTARIATQSTRPDKRIQRICLNKEAKAATSNKPPKIKYPFLHWLNTSKRLYFISASIFSGVTPSILFFAC